MTIRVSAFKFTPLAFAVALTASLSVMAPAASAAGRLSDVSTSNRPVQDTSMALVQLKGEPLSTNVKTKPAKGKKIDFNNSVTKSYRAQLSALRNDYKAWLRKNVPGAKVTGEFDISLNAVAVQLNGASLAQVSATPMVATAQYQGIFYPNVVSSADPDLALISATNAWALNGGSSNAGAGMKVAIIDSGIDHTHPCFSDAGYTPVQKIGDSRFTNNKVIAAKVFNNKLNQSRFTAEGIGEHGTHVAGTVACNYATPATVNGAVIPYAMSGVAPKALLGSYNVFPGTVEGARSEDILNALEAAYQDGFDVANMSLGGGSHGIQDLVTHAVDNIDQANMVVAISAGNSGPGGFTVGSPGMAARALTAGASAVPHFVAAPVTTPTGTYGAASGDFAVVANNLTANLGVTSGTGVAGLSTACTSLGTNTFPGQILLVSRGTCAFTVKVRNAQAAGAVAVLVSNNAVGDPGGMATDGTPSQPTIPAYMVSIVDGTALQGQAGASTTIGASQAYFATTNGDLMANFSSEGPTDVDFRIKPDVVAPGVNVLSSIPKYLCAGQPCFALFNGTSMASPHLAGSAAVVKQQHGDWSAAMIRSAIVNTADRGVLRNFATAAPQDVVNITGAGRENLLAAVSAQVALDPVSISFGMVPVGSGLSRKANMMLTNTTGGSLTYTLGLSGAAAGMYSLSTTSVTLAGGASANVTVTMTGSQGSAGGKQAYLEVSTGQGNVAHAALYTLVK
ncbi:MAG TPA: S8 family serine peptidase [Ramlibacter sp.]|nr:S8 family serine peptidase [Ramlibacter sp.]